MSPVIKAILFAIVASPETYKLTRSIGGDWIASADGAAKFPGLILHAIVFVILSKLVYSMFGKKRSSNYQYATGNGWGGATTLGGTIKLDEDHIGM